MKKAFTLIELLVVVSIIIILAGAVMVNLQSARVKGRDVKRKADIESVATALEIYYAQNKVYPIFNTITNTNWSNLKVVLYPTYINSWPTDPKSSSSGGFPSNFNYFYLSNSEGTMYIVDARYEGKNDQTIDSSISFDPANINNFFVTGQTDKDTDGKYHYRISGR